MSELPADPDRSVVVKHSWWYHAFLWTAFPIMGGLAGWIVSMVPGWVDRLAWVPMQGPIQLIGQATGPIWGVIALVVIGAIAGGFITLSAYDEILSVKIEPDQVQIFGPGDNHWASPRTAVAAVFPDKSDLVMTDKRGVVLIRIGHDFDADRFSEPFTSMGYPWFDQDPHEAEYVRWVPGMPGLPDRADAYLNARQSALIAGEKDEVLQLTQELAALGVMVTHDKKKRQRCRVVSG